MLGLIGKAQELSEVSLPKAFRFRISMPYILCEEKSALKSVVDLVGCSAGFVYAVLIPLCLLYLYLRQRAVLLASVRTIGAATGSDAELRVRVHEVRSQKVADLPRRLAAAAAAYIAVLRRGREPGIGVHVSSRVFSFQ